LLPPYNEKQKALPEEIPGVLPLTRQEKAIKNKYTLTTELIEPRMIYLITISSVVRPFTVVW